LSRLIGLRYFDYNTTYLGRICAVTVEASRFDLEAGKVVARLKSRFRAPHTDHSHFRRQRSSVGQKPLGEQLICIQLNSVHGFTSISEDSELRPLTVLKSEETYVSDHMAGDSRANWKLAG
jgi:hypothetical protein